MSLEVHASTSIRSRLEQYAENEEGAMTTTMRPTVGSRAKAACVALFQGAR